MSPMLGGRGGSGRGMGSGRGGGEVGGGEVGGGGSGKGMKNAQINHCAFTGNRENNISTHFLVFRKYAFTWQRFFK